VVDIDVLRYVITGDNKGLKQAASESDLLFAKMARDGGQSLSRLQQGMANTFHQRQRNLVDAINHSIVQLTGSMVPLGSSAGLVAVGLSRITGVLGAMGGGLVATAASLGIMGLALAFTRKEVVAQVRPLEANIEAVKELAESTDRLAESSRAYLQLLIAQKQARLTELETQYDALAKQVEKTNDITKKFYETEKLVELLQPGVAAQIAGLRKELEELKKTFGCRHSSIRKVKKRAREVSKGFVGGITVCLWARNRSFYEKLEQYAKNVGRRREG